MFDVLELGCPTIRLDYLNWTFIYFHSSTNRDMSEKHVSKLCEKILDAYGKGWKEEDRETKCTEVLDSIIICCQNSDLVSTLPQNNIE